MERKIREKAVTPVRDLMKSRRIRMNDAKNTNPLVMPKRKSLLNLNRDGKSGGVRNALS